MVAADEISALVIEVGTCSTKAGYSGEDTPKAYFQTAMGEDNSQMDTDGKKYRFAENAQHFAENMEIVHPLENGLVDNWDKYTALLDYAINSKLRANAEESPLVICEPSFNTTEQRMKMAELAFEKFNVPAFYVAKRGVLSAFATGKSTALVIDIGAGQTVVTPVYDGYVIKKGVTSENVAGDFLTRESVAMLEQANINLTPHFKIARRKQVDLGSPAEVTLKRLQNVTRSFEMSAKLNVAKDFKETICAMSDSIFNEANLAIRPQKSFEFPSGQSASFGAERFKIPEILFNPKVGSFQDIPESFGGIPLMIQNALNTVDVDVRPHLLSNVVLVGGSSSFMNIADRLNNELVRFFPGSKIRLYSPGSTAERRFSSWIGGSILSSLGTFQQMWISKQEYEENGASIVEKQCS